MKNILKTFAVVGVILLTALMTAFSCDGYKNPFTSGSGTGNSGGSSGSGSGSGSGNGGGGSSYTGPIEFTGVDATLVKINDTKIFLKASAFPTQVAGTVTADARDIVDVSPPIARKKAFDITFKGATGGIIVVTKGNVTDPKTVSAKTTGEPDIWIALTTDQKTDALDGISSIREAGTTMSLNSIFASKTAPANAAANAANVEPFAFTASTSADAPTQPVFWCKTLYPGGTGSINLNGTDAEVLGGTLKGGQKSTCSVASVGIFALGGNNGGGNPTAPAWLASTAPANIKKEIEVSILAIKTDTTTIGNLGFTGTDAQKAAAFKDGIDAADMDAIITTAGAANVEFRKYKIKIVSDADFTTGP